MKHLKKNTITRRDFIKNTSIGIAGTLVAPTILASSCKGANDRLLIAHIGLGSRGGAELNSYFLPLTESLSVATCDPFQKRREGAANFINDTYREKDIKAPECKPYLNFEEILRRKDIDAVVINTPDHWHVPAAIKAARAGKHIWLAKPLGLSYPNFKILEQELKRNKVKFQYGTQQRASYHMQEGIQMIKDGVLGDIEKVFAYCPGKNNVPSPACVEVPVPPDFDYDKWTGPAPLNPYCPDRVTNNSSWFQWDYSIGFLAGWGAHPLDIMVWALKEKISTRYSCQGTGNYWEPGGMYDNILSWDVNYEYESGVKVHFVSTDVAQQNGLLDHLHEKSNGTTFFGTKGWLNLSRGSVESNIPELVEKLKTPPEIPLPGFGQVFLDVIQGKTQELCPIEDAILSDCASHMGNIAIRTGQKITWDPVKGEIVGNQEAFNKWFVREMRKPYQV